MSVMRLPEGKEDREQLQNIRRHNAERALKQGMHKAKENIRKHNRAVAELAETCRKLENTVYMTTGPVSKFLCEHGMAKEGEPLPIGDDLLQLLHKAVERARQVALVQARQELKDG